jgi:three-Cys-motif partner protein
VSEARVWHAWSRWKTQVLLGAYLPAFTMACKNAHHKTFIDCFAGTPDAVDHAGNAFDGSPRIALNAVPPLTHAVFFEVEDNAAALETALRTEFPTRQFHVVGGDCNGRISEGLNWVRNQGSPTWGPHLGPVFVLLDPDSMQLRWSTVETIANWTGQSAPGDYRRKNKPELLILFPTGPFRRTMPTERGSEEASPGARADADRLFGNDKWTEIYAAQRSGAITGEESWMHYVELYRLGLMELGYTYTCVIEVKNTRNVVMYHLVFATQNSTGKRIMKDVQKRARTILPAMVEDEKAARKAGGAIRLFEEPDDDLDRYAQNPDKWAYFTDDQPQAFDPSRHRSPPELDDPPTLF